MDAAVGPDPKPRFTAGTAGFTLIELMVVIAILALLTVSVSLGVNRPQSVNAQDWSRFQTVYKTLREQAVLGQEVLGLMLSRQGYQRMRREGAAWTNIGDPIAWRGKVQVQAPFDPDVPVAFQPKGQSTPVRLRFEDGARVVFCECDGWAKISCVAG